MVVVLVLVVVVLVFMDVSIFVVELVYDSCAEGFAGVNGCLLIARPLMGQATAV